jgi:hypothetical protein
LHLGHSLPEPADAFTPFVAKMHTDQEGAGIDPNVPPDYILHLPRQ